jgi:hypothetical protein
METSQHSLAEPDESRAELIRRIVITVTLVFLLGLLPGLGCAGRYRGPRSLAALATVLVAGGGAAWVVGERYDQRTPTNVGFALVSAGVAAAVAAGGWMAASVGCDADPDCDDVEQCREVPAPPGGIPYKQCVPR